MAVFGGKEEGACARIRAVCCGTAEYNISELQNLGKETGGGGDEVVAGVALALLLEEAEAVEFAMLFLETLAEGTDGVVVASEAADEGHAVDTAAGLLQPREAATEGSGHGEGLLGRDREEIGESHDDGLAAVVALLVELAGALLAGGDFVGLHKAVYQM